MDDEAVAEELWLDVMTKTKYFRYRKETKTTQSLMFRVMIINECHGHKYTFTRAVSHAYK
jgi:G:T-mismatch repair DNA endonuclease (very short patch repair protein)